MEHTNNRFLPSPTDRSERQPKMDPRAWLLKVLIVRMELQQKDPAVFMRSLPPDDLDFGRWSLLRRDLLVWSSISNNVSDRFALACETAALDAWALFDVMLRVDKNDNLREVFARAVRSIREALLQAGASYDNDFKLFYILQRELLEHLASKPGSKQEYADASQSDSELAIAYTLHAFLTSVLHLLTSVFQYLVGCVDRGGSKTYSSGAFDFRASFVALVLFQGAYVWIKFREAARPDCRKRKAPEVVDIETCNLEGVCVRRTKDKSSGAIIRVRYESRFTPLKQEGDDGTYVRSKRLSLGEHHTPAEAQIVRQIARYYYGEDEGCVELKYGPCKFLIPPMSEQERGLAGEAKREWVTRRAKQVGKQMFAAFEREKGKQLAMATEAGSHRAESSDPSSSARPLPSSPLTMVTTVAVEPAIGSAAPSSPSLSLPPFDGASMGDADDFSEDPSAIKDMIAELAHGPGLPILPVLQSSVVSYQMHYQEFAQLPGDPSLSEVGTAAGGIEHLSEAVLNPSPGFQPGRDLAVAGTENIDGRVFLPKSVPDLQQLVLCQKKSLEDNARHFVDLDYQLKACQIQNSRLQQEKEQFQQEKDQSQQEREKLQREKEQLQQENESLKSKLQQVANLSCNLDWNPDGHST